MKEIELKPCPFCGGNNIKCGAFAIVTDCYVECTDCGAMFETEVPWGNMNEEEHDRACLEKLAKLWNRREG